MNITCVRPGPQLFAARHRACVASIRVRPANIERAFERARARTERRIILPPDTNTNVPTANLIDPACGPVPLARRLLRPSLGSPPNRWLMCYGTDRADQFRRRRRMPPATFAAPSLPIFRCRCRPSIETVINLKTAKALACRCRRLSSSLPNEVIE